MLNERRGPVRIFVNAPFAFRGSVISTSKPAGADHRSAGRGVRSISSARSRACCSRPTLISCSRLSTARSTGGRSSRRTSRSTPPCRWTLCPRIRGLVAEGEFREADPAECAGHDLEIVAHQGVTRALFEGEEALGTGKRVQAVEDFTFTFNEPVHAREGPLGGSDPRR